MVDDNQQLLSSKKMMELFYLTQWISQGFGLIRLQILKFTQISGVSFSMDSFIYAPIRNLSVCMDDQTSVGACWHTYTCTLEEDFATVAWFKDGGLLNETQTFVCDLQGLKMFINKIFYGLVVRCNVLILDRSMRRRVL